MNVLLIAYFYHPLNRIASRRPMGFVRYLSCLGVSPYVITKDWNSSIYCDRDLTDEDVASSVVGRTPADGTEFNQPTLAERMRNFVQGARAPRDWSDNAIRLSEEFRQKVPVDVILCTYPPMSSLYVASRLSRRWKVPWVADMRDIAGEHPAKTAIHRITIARHLRWEKNLLSGASEIVSVSRGLMATLAMRHNQRVSVIPNGYDPKTFYPSLDERRDRFSLVYTGAIHFATTLRPVGEALSRLFAAGEMDPSDIVVQLVGTNERDARGSFGFFNVWPRVRIYDWQPRETVAFHQREAAVLLHATFPDVRGIMTGKIYEYLAARRPIMTVPGDGDCVDALLQETNGGVSCRDSNSVADFLSGLYREWRKSGKVPMSGNRSEIESYSYRNLSKRMVGILTRVSRP